MKSNSKRIAVLLAALLIAGCAAQKLHDEGVAAFDRGDYELGLAKLEQASEREPYNLSYRLDLRARQESSVQKLISSGDDALANGRLQAAETDYRRVLVLEPGNDRAQRGLARIQIDRQHADRIAHAQAEFNAKRYDVAESEVRAVLAEDPGFAPAKALQVQIEVARGPVAAVPRLRARDNRPITLQFRDAPTKMVFEVLARQSGINFIFDKDVKSDGKTTIFVSQVPVEEAIDLILAQNQLSRQVLSDNMVLVYPSTQAKQKDYQDEIVHTFFLANAVPKDAESMLKTVLASKTIFTDERSNTVTLRDTPEHVRMAEKLIASLDEPEAEVIMEVEILELSHTMADQIGIQYPSTATLSANPVGTAIGNLNKNLTLYDLQNQNSHTITVTPISATVNLQKTVGNTNVLATPRIRAKNKEKAKILVGDRVPVVTSGTSATTGGSYSTSSVQYLEVGLTLEVQPVIHNDGNVVIKVQLEVSSIADTINVPNGNGGSTLAYQISTRNANTTLELRDGETQVLAGLIQDSDSHNSNRIPGLGDLPLLGRLFGTNGTNKAKSEIVMSITPRIIRAQPRPPSDVTEFWYGSESQTRSAPFVSSPAAAPAPAAGPAAGPQAMPGGVSYGGGGATMDAAPPVSHAAPARMDATANAAPLVMPANAAPGAGASPLAAAAVAGGVAATGPGAPPAARAPSGKPRVTLDGPATAKVGDEITVSVKLDSADPLGRVRAQVRFDASALQLISAEPGDLAPAGDTPKIDLKPGGLQLELAGGAGTPVDGTGSVVDMHFRVMTARPAVSIDTQVVLVGEDGVAVAATAATPLKIAVSP